MAVVRVERGAPVVLAGALGRGHEPIDGHADERRGILNPGAGLPQDFHDAGRRAAVDQGASLLDHRGQEGVAEEPLEVRPRRVRQGGGRPEDEHRQRHRSQADRGDARGGALALLQEDGLGALVRART